MRAAFRNQRGGALIVVMMVGMVIAIGFMGFLTSSVLVEQRAVEGSLAKARAYWAQMGHFNYAISRISLSKFCNTCLITQTNIKDTDLASVLQAYLDELNAMKTWTYPDESSAYYITIAETAAPDESPLRQNFSGWLKATSSYTSSSVVSGLNSHLPLMEMRLCVGLANAGAKCGDIGLNNGGRTTAYFSVNRLTNLPG